jgi:hypothetical protein
MSPTSSVPRRPAAMSSQSKFAAPVTTASASARPEVVKPISVAGLPESFRAQRTSRRTVDSTTPDSSLAPGAATRPVTRTRSRRPHSAGVRGDDALAAPVAPVAPVAPAAFAPESPSPPQPTLTARSAVTAAPIAAAASGRRATSSDPQALHGLASALDALVLLDVRLGHAGHLDQREHVAAELLLHRQSALGDLLELFAGQRIGPVSNHPA